MGWIKVLGLFAGIVTGLAAIGAAVASIAEGRSVHMLIPALGHDFDLDLLVSVFDGKIDREFQEQTRELFGSNHPEACNKDKPETLPDSSNGPSDISYITYVNLGGKFYTMALISPLSPKVADPNVDAGIPNNGTLTAEGEDDHGHNRSLFTLVRAGSDYNLNAVSDTGRISGSFRMLPSHTLVFKGYFFGLSCEANGDVLCGAILSKSPNIETSELRHYLTATRCRTLGIAR